MNDAHHLSQIETRWATVLQAHAGDAGDETLRAQARLLERYGGAVHRYLLATTRDPDRAADLAQDFAVKVLRGAFRTVDPRRGRFRDFIKRAVINLVRDQQRADARSREKPSALAETEPAVDPDDGWIQEHDDAFLNCWREELVSRAWADLKAYQDRFDHPYHDVLRLRTDRADLRSAELASALSERLGRPVDANWFRQNVLRARQHYVRFLLVRIAATLGPEGLDALEDELIALKLLDYCRKELPDFLAKRNASG
jgi:RNA polymerase sigma-70 factor (ECF subfamily)